MTIHYRKTSPGLRENLGAGMAALGAAAGVAAVTFYFVRILMAREAIPGEPPELRSEGASSPGPEAHSPRED